MPHLGVNHYPGRTGDLTTRDLEQRLSEQFCNALYRDCVSN